MKPESPDRWVKCISTQGNIRGVAIQATQLVGTAANLHDLKGEGIRRLGEAIMGGLLLASYCKRGERINLNIRGSGTSRQALVDAYPDATVRGYIIEGENIDLLEGDVGPWGVGTLSVLKTKDQEGQTPYIGTVPLLTGHLAKDLSFYWAQSEQIPSAVGLAVGLEKDRVTSAGGFLIQALPGASLTEIKAIEHHILEIESLAESFAKASSPVQILSQIFQNSAFMVVEEKPLEFKCQCSWERVRRALVLVGVAELESMLGEGKSAIVRCDFCSRQYEVDKAALTSLIETVQSQEVSRK